MRGRVVLSGEERPADGKARREVTAAKAATTTPGDLTATGDIVKALAARALLSTMISKKTLPRHNQEYANVKRIVMVLCLVSLSYLVFRVAHHVAHVGTGGAADQRAGRAAVGPCLQRTGDDACVRKVPSRTAMLRCMIVVDGQIDSDD